MGRLAFIGLLSTLVLIAVAPAGASTAGCSPGVKAVGGVTERTFCGSAKASVHYGSQTFSFAGGDCMTTSSYLSVNIGTVVLGITSKPMPDYFGLDVGRTPGSTVKPAGKDGTYSNDVTLAMDYGGKGYLVLPTGLTVVLSGNRTRGSISGTAFGGAGKVSGSFTC